MDPISDMITIIRNAGAVHKETVTFPYSKVKYAIADKLLKTGFISAVEKKGNNLCVSILYIKGKHRISGITRVSKVSNRIYSGIKDIRPVKHGMGISIISTPKGMLTDTEARKEKAGGEIILKVW